MEIKCDIILPVCDQFRFTKDCIESIISNTSTPYRLIVVNNGTSDDTKKYLSEIKARLGDRLVVIENATNVGWVRALNQGIERSHTPFLCFQNDDTIVTKGWLAKMIGILERDKRIGVVNPEWEGRPNYISIEDYGRSLEEKHKGRYIETDWARGFCVVFRKDVLDAIGKVDEEYNPAYFDDVDFSVRAINAGFLVVRSLDTYVYHHRNATFFEVLKGKKWNEVHERNKHLYYRKWGRPLKIVMVLDGESCGNADAVRRAKETVFYLARKQHHLKIWAPSALKDQFQHTNVIVISPPGFLKRLSVLLDLRLNSGKKAGKRYDGVFIFEKKFGNFLTRNRSLKNLGIYFPDGGTDFHGFIKYKVNAMKEATKSMEGR